MKKPMVFIVLVIWVALFTMPPLVYAQAPDTQPIIINPLADGRIEVMPSNLPFDVRNLRAVGDPTTTASSYDEASVLIHEAASTANKIAATDVEIARVNNLGWALNERIKAHNAQWPNGCVYTEQNPRACDGWVKEGKEQNEELRKLKTEYEYLKGVRGTLRSHLSIIQSRLRLGAFLDKLTPWQKTVVACSKMENSEQAELCLKGAWERRP